jgi:CDP-glucose 4,6-dehydratase
MRPGGINREFWQGRRVFLTGHTGFMGGWLALWLARLGAKVHGYALPPPTDPGFFAAADVPRDIVSTIADIRDLGALRQAMADARPEIVMHLAAQPLVRQAYADPVTTYATNIMGTVHVLEAMRACGSVQAAVIVTSDKVYENQERGRGYSEDDRLGGREPYGSSKAGAELVTRAYRDSYFAGRTSGVGIATARAGNVIGGGDFAADRIVPDAIRAWAAGRQLVVRNPAATRPWQHVLEPICGYLMLAERLAEKPADWSEGWNFGPAEADVKPVAWLVTELARNWGDGAGWAPANEGTGPYEAKLLAVDIAKAQRKLGWRPVWPVAEAVAQTVIWYRDFIVKSDARKRSLEQIEEFENAA